MKKTFLSMAFAFAATGGAIAQTPAWLRLSQPANYANFDVQEVATGTDATGNIYTAASVYDSVNNQYKAMLVKYDANGNQQWLKTQLDATYAFAESDVVKVLVDASGNSYVIGYAKHNGTSDWDYMVIRYDNAGNQTWIQYWDGGQNDGDYPTCATFDAAGNIVVGGYVAGVHGNDFGVVKWSPSGTLTWSYTWNNASGNDEDRIAAIASDASNNIFVTGSTYGTNSRDMVTMKLNSSGANQWTKIYAYTNDHNDDFGRSITTDAAGNCYVAGGADYFITIKYDANGNQLWKNSYTTYETTNENRKRVMIDKYNHVVVVGDAFVSTSHQTDVIVNMIDNTTGATIWSNNFDLMSSSALESSDILEDAAVDGSGNIYINERVDGAAGDDIATMVLNNAGTMRWHASYTNTSYTIGADRGYQMVLDKDRNVIIAGVSQLSADVDKGVGVLTMKYSASGIPTAVQQLTAGDASVTIYPNPSTGIVHINALDKSLVGARVNVTSLTGQTIQSATLTAQPQELNLSNLAKGIYLLNIRSEAGVMTRKLVIE